MYGLSNSGSSTRFHESCNTTRSAAGCASLIWLSSSRSLRSRRSWLSSSRSLRSRRSWLVPRTHVREQQHVADARRVRQQHHEPIDPEPFPRGRWQTMLERGDVVLVVLHRLEVTARLAFRLFAVSLGLCLGIVQLGEAVRDLAACNEELEPIGDFRIAVVAAREWRHFRRVLDDEKRRD